MGKHKLPKWVTRMMVSGAISIFTLCLPDPRVLLLGDIAPYKNQVFRECTTSWGMIPHHHIVSSPTWSPSYAFKKPLHHYQASSFWMVQYVLGQVDHMVIYKLPHLL